MGRTAFSAIGGVLALYVFGATGAQATRPLLSHRAIGCVIGGAFVPYTGQAMGSHFRRPQKLPYWVGNGRGGLTAAQRADVVGLARTWMHEGTGAITVEVPSHTPNARAAADSLREIRSLLSIGGVPANGVIVRHYRSPSRQFFAPIRLTYARVKADAGPCGMWPEDLGPSIKNKSYLENKSYWNFGCATQRNLAAMVDNPADLVQPRPETPAYTGRRNVVFDKYRKGERTAAQQTEAEKAKISSVGQ